MNHTGEGGPEGLERQGELKYATGRLKAFGGRAMDVVRGIFSRGRTIRQEGRQEGPVVNSFAPPESFITDVIRPHKNYLGVIDSLGVTDSVLNPSGNPSDIPKTPDSGNAFVGRPTVVSFAPMPGGIPTSEGSMGIGNHLPANPDNLITEAPKNL